MRANDGGGVGDTPTVFCFDIDGTLCTNTWGDYEDAEPFREAIAAVNEIYDAGSRILLYTARGSETGIDWREITERQLAGWGLRYHELWFGKPSASVYVDDRAFSAEDWRANGFSLDSARIPALRKRSL